MKLLACGDLHLTDEAPRNRCDDYEETVFRKLNFIFETAEEEGCSHILQPGDFFDKARPSYSLFSKIVYRIKELDVLIITLFGQHDMRYRNLLNTGLNALDVACPGNVIMTPFIDFKYYNLKERVHLHCVNYGQEIPTPSAEKYNILLIHKMIVNKKLWSGQVDFVQDSDFLNKNKFDLVISGDNHQAFSIINKSGPCLLNGGSMMRATTAQINHQPLIWVVDTEEQSVKEIKIPIEPAEDVFRVENIMREKERNEKLDLFIDGLSEHKETGLVFEDDLMKYIEDNKIEQGVVDLIKEGMS